MEEPNPKSADLFISIAFYSFYFLYMFTYAYEAIFIFYTKTSFLLICVIFICTFVSVIYDSYGLVICSWFFVIIVASIEITKFTNYRYGYFWYHGFYRFFLITRLFVTLLFIIFYTIHIINLKNTKFEQLNNGNVENATTPPSISRAILPEHNIQASTFNNSNNPDMPRNYINRTVVDIEKDNDNFIEQKNKEDIEDISVKKICFPTISKDDIQSISMRSNIGSIKKIHPYSHYKVMASEYLNDPRTVKLKMSTPDMNDVEINNEVISMNKSVIENNIDFETNHILYNNDMGNIKK
ncbi:conserved Plasmodium protein, unknown function [Plasmodium vinckei vinckei]|uniref:Uncharacterized protein n=1 Tax=Plasmodium vinckei vinckei TaxID=54757 RepID=A0A449BRP1_PLAVN|nr:conserved Plasmodium protein, unknown function [Plasmodium vinckei vinckei]VEV56073.1 conserved Plasmodium protein, unknown function [Plasmodium vinckei vinckei]